ncbi:MAG: (2Fe-2S) ferredoxin domain-containing protein [Spirochaetes bacterium]|nr:(2Fe-2S) ferredoxin domain-containing protein [Spirochaetota bacterium]
MSKLTLASFDAYQDGLKKEPVAKGSIVVSLGTCGIAAGGDKVYETFQQELSDKHIPDIELKRTGCLGMCFCEPNLMVKMEGMPDVLYGFVTPEIASRIIDEHVGKKHIVNDHVIFMPAQDLCGTLRGE